MAERVGHFSDTYPSLINRYEGVKEPEFKGPDGVSKKITEEIVRCLWFGRHFDTAKLYTEDGSRLEVVSPGWWNVEGGPDHLRAEIILEGKGLVKGDVEIHVLASDWTRHGHDRQEEYKDVCLHVVMWNDTTQGFVKDCTGRLIPQLALAKYVASPLEELPDVIEAYLAPLEKGRWPLLPGPCQEVLSRRRGAFDRLGHILDQAGDHRILARAGRFQRSLETKSYEGVLYEALMEAMGYKNNALQFSRLASLVTLEDLRSRVPMDAPFETRALWIQAVLLGAGGMLSQWQGCDYDEDGREYVESLRRLRHETGKRKKLMEASSWRWSSSRPLNSPPRRIAALSHLFARFLDKGFFKELLGAFEEAKDKERAKKAVKRIENYFTQTQDPFWSYHLSPGKRLKVPTKLIGKERAAAIFINVILPLLLVYARKEGEAHLEAQLHEAYCGYPRLSSDSVLRFMSQRVLPKESAPKLVNTARRQQGLHQIFRDFCQRKDVGCHRCGLFAAIERQGR
ncbi:MAG TPA: DUF2851 family protein [Candidatus Hypogeohydataceae bacterium YC38]